MGRAKCREWLDGVEGRGKVVNTIHALNIKTQKGLKAGKLMCSPMIVEVQCKPLGNALSDVSSSSIDEVMLDLG